MVSIDQKAGALAHAVASANRRGPPAIAIDFKEEAMALRRDVSEHAYPAADGSADIDNNAIPVIEAKLRDVATRAAALATQTKNVGDTHG